MKKLFPLFIVVLVYMYGCVHLASEQAQKGAVEANRSSRPSYLEYRGITLSNESFQCVVSSKTSLDLELTILQMEHSYRFYCLQELLHEANNCGKKMGSKNNELIKFLGEVSKLFKISDVYFETYLDSVSQKTHKVWLKSSVATLDIESLKRKSSLKSDFFEMCIKRM